MKLKILNLGWSGKKLTGLNIRDIWVKLIGVVCLQIAGPCSNAAWGVFKNIIINGNSKFVPIIERPCSKRTISNKINSKNYPNEIKNCKIKEKGYGGDSPMTGQRLL